jgi:hypothetical protein
MHDEQALGFKDVRDRREVADRSYGIFAKSDTFTACVPKLPIARV